MGLILECHALAPHAGVRPGVLLGSVPVNSLVVEDSLGPLAAGPMAGLDFAASGPAGIRFHPLDLPSLITALAASGVEPNIANTIADAAEEALHRQAWLWIGLA